jgi:hypothetical protein
MCSSGFTPKQVEVLAALAQGSSVTAAARAAGLHRTTIHNWARILPDFRAMLEDAKISRAEAIADKLYDLSNAACDTLQSVLDDKTASTAQRLKAALTVIRSSTARPAPLPQDDLSVAEYNLIVDDIFNAAEEDAAEPSSAEPSSAEPPPTPTEMPTVAVESSPEIHHNSSLFITKDENPQPAPVAIPRSAPCPCGSGQKFKRCCGRNAPPVLSVKSAAA